MQNLLRSSLVLAAALSLGAAMPTALAATSATWTVKPGGAVTAKFSRMILRDARTGAVVACPSTVKATLATGTGLSGNGIGSISSFTFGTCTGPLGITFTLKTEHLPYTLNAASYNAMTGTTTGSITGIHGSFEGPSCSFVLDGTGASKDNGILVVKYVNGSHTLEFVETGDRLHAYKAVGCGFLAGVKNGDSFTVTGTATVTPAQTITSP